MPRPSSVRKVQQIYDAASAVFMELGYDGASMEAIAKRSGVSKATVYAHFANKEDLFAALIRHECAIISGGIYRPNATSPDLAEELRRMARNITALFVAENGLSLYRILIPVAPRFPRLGEIFHREGPLTVRQIFATFFREAHALGRLAIPDPDLAAQQFMSLIRGDLDFDQMLMLPMRPERDVEALVEGGIRLFLEAYRSGAEAPAPDIRAEGLAQGLRRA